MRHAGRRLGIVALGLGAWLFALGEGAALAMVKAPHAGAGSAARDPQTIALHSAVFGPATWAACIVLVLVAGLFVARRLSRSTPERAETS
jgi:hypothetical protein